MPVYLLRTIQDRGKCNFDRESNADGLHLDHDSEVISVWEEIKVEIKIKIVSVIYGLHR